MQGTLSSGTVAEIVRELVTGKKSGLLFLSSAGQERAIYLASGAIVNAESNVAEEGLGFRLLDLGLLTPQALQAAMRQVEPGRSLAQVLEASGAVEAGELERVQRQLVESIVAGVFDLREGSYFFQEGDYSFKGGFELNTPWLILEGVRRMFEFDGVRERLLADPRPLRPLVASGQPLQLEPTEGFILSRVDGSLAVRDICALSIISEEMTCRVLFGLLTAGVIGHPPSGTSRPGPARPEAPPSRPEASRPAGAPRFEPGPAPASPPPPSASAPRPAASAPSPSASAPRPAPAGPRVEAWRPEADAPSSPRPAAGERRVSATETTGSSTRPPAAGPARPAWQEERKREIEQLFETADRLNHYALLGLGRDATTPAIEEAYRKLAERLHPAKNPWITDDTLRSRLVFVFAKIKAAHQTLAQDRSRIEYDEQLRRHDKEAGQDVNIGMQFVKTERQKAQDERIKESETLYREAQRLYEAQRFHDARTKVLKAIDVLPNEARYYALAGRIEMLNPNLRWQKDAENHLRKAVELDRWNPDYRVALGLLYKNAGLSRKAKREFIAALEIDPTNETALSEVPVGERPAKRDPDSQPPPAGGDDVSWS